MRAACAAGHRRRQSNEAETGTFVARWNKNVRPTCSPDKNVHLLGSGGCCWRAGRGTATSCARLLPLSVEGSAGREAGFRCKKTLVCVRAQGRDCRESQKTIQKCIVLGGWQPECLSERTGAPRASVLTLVEIRSVFSHDSAAAWSRRHESLRWRPSCTISHAQAIHRRPDRGDDSERARDHSIDHARQLSSLSANRGDESEFGSPRRSPGIRACNRARRVTEVSEHGL